jgi:phage shock protein E
MSTVICIVIVLAVAAVLLMKRLGWVKPMEAREWLKKGALVIDVRSEGEFQERHLAGAINIPLGQLGNQIAQRAPNKEQPLLLHCLSGARSGMGASNLRRLGYQHVFNLGSYGRAESILRASQG